MISSEVQRTLVKSPPELWTELSDPSSLARHLTDFGEIRITRVEPETTVEWEADSAAGSVSIKPSGWGTRVTLKARRELPQTPSPAEPAADGEPEDIADVGAATEPEAAAARETIEPEADAARPAAAGPGAAAAPEGSAAHACASEPELAQWQAQAWENQREPEPEPDPEPAAEPQPRRGFLTRIFGRRRRKSPMQPPASVVDEDPDPAREDREPSAGVPAPRICAASGTELTAPEASPQDLVADDARAEPAPQGASEPAPHEAAEQPLETHEAATPETQEPASREPGQETEAEEHAADISAELAAAEETAAEEVRAALTTMLDRLGTAHHRPFSRA